MNEHETQFAEAVAPEKRSVTRTPPPPALRAQIAIAARRWLTCGVCGQLNASWRRTCATCGGLLVVPPQTQSG